LLIAKLETLILFFLVPRRIFFMDLGLYRVNSIRNEHHGITEISIINFYESVIKEIRFLLRVN